MAAATQGAILHHVRRLVAARGAEGQTDGELLRAFADGQDRAVFAVLVRRHGPMVFHVCRRVLRHQQDAEDAFQATFLILARNAAALRNGQALAAWLHRAAYRVALGVRRAAARRRHHEGKATAMTSREPSADVAWQELQAVLEDEVQRLPEKYRMAFVLCCLEGHSRAEAARMLGVKEGTISSRIDQARKRLQGRLARRGVTLSAVLAAMALADRAQAVGPLARLCSATARAAAGGAVGAGVAALVEQGTRTLFAGRSKVVSLLLAAWLAAGVGLLACQPVAEGNRPEEPAGQRQPAVGKPARADANGDPLPDEALARLGTLRFRPGGFVSSLVFAPDAKTVVALEGKGNVCVLDAADGRALRRFATGTARRRPALSGDGRWAAVLSGPGNLPIDPEASLELWDCSRGTKVRTFGKAPFASACFSPDGKVLAGLRYDGVVELWDPHAGRLLRSWKTGDGPGYDLFFTGSFTADGKTLLTSHKKQTVRCWDVATGDRLREFSGLPPSDLFAVSSRGVLAVDGRDPAPAKKGEPAEIRVRLIDVTTGKDLARLAAPPGTVPRDRPTWFIRGEFSPDGKLLATAGSDGQVRLWDVAAGKQVRSWLYSANFPGALGFSPDGRRLALADAGTTVRLLDVAGGEEVASPPGHHSGFFQPAFTPDGQTVLTLGTADPTLHVWDPATGRQRQRQDWPVEQMAGFPALSRDAATIFARGADRNLRSWDLATGKETRCWRDDYGSPYFSGIVPSPDSKTLALIYQDPTIVLVDAAGKELRRLQAHAPWPFGAAFSPDGRSLVTWGADAKARVWDLATGRELRQISFTEVRNPRAPVPPGGVGVTIFSAAVSPDGRLLAFGSRNGAIVIHELVRGEEVRRIDGLAQGLSVRAFSPDGRTLAWSAAGNATVHLLEVTSGKERHQLVGHLGDVTAVAFSPDGRRLVSASEDTTALVWDLGPAAPADGEAAWKDLADADAARAYRAVRRLAASPAFFGDRLRPVTAADEARTARLIADLDGENFAAREKAAAELERLGEAAGPACRKALDRQPSAEVRRRLEALLEKTARAAWEITPERLRVVRSLEALELSGTPEARQVLEKLAGGAEGAWLSEAARAGLRRLENRAKAR
jgi:RNA polymerase sigma factor (sigma-70 family)